MDRKGFFWSRKWSFGPENGGLSRKFSRLGVVMEGFVPDLIHAGISPCPCASQEPSLAQLAASPPRQAGSPKNCLFLPKTSQDAASGRDKWECCRSPSGWSVRILREGLGGFARHLMAFAKSHG